MIIDDDVVSAVDGNVQVGDALDGVADQVQVLPTVIVRPPENRTTRQHFYSTDRSHKSLSKPIHVFQEIIQLIYLINLI